MKRTSYEFKVGDITGIDIDTYLGAYENLWPSWKEEIKRREDIYAWYIEGEQGCGKSTAVVLFREY